MVLSPSLYANTIRVIKHGTVEQAWFVRNATHATLRRLRVARNGDKAETRTPAGSDQVNLGGLVSWLNSIETGDEASIEQLLKIDATALARTS